MDVERTTKLEDHYNANLLNEKYQRFRIYFYCADDSPQKPRTYCSSGTRYFDISSLNFQSR